MTLTARPPVRLSTLFLSRYGKDFRYANYMDWGYGGYMTSFLVTKTDRFQAASMGAGLPM